MRQLTHTGRLRRVKRFFEQRAVFDHPPVDGGVIHVDTALEHEFFDVARAQRVGDIPPDARQNDLLGAMGTFEAHHHRLSPSLGIGVTEKEHTPNRLKGKLPQNPCAYDSVRRVAGSLDHPY
jgi:hypothetical protein